MAIKGKRKSRGHRAPGAAPRQFLVQPKVPLFRRTETIFVLVLLFWVAVFSLLIGAGAASEADRHRDEIARFTTAVDGALSQNQVAQPLAGSRLILPDMATALAELVAEEVRPRQIAERAADWQERATTASEEVAVIETTDPALTEVRILISRSLALYAGLARQVEIATRAEGEIRTDLVSSIEQDAAAAAAVFDAAWTQLTEERADAGLDPLPGGTGVPEGLDLPLPGATP